MKAPETIRYGIGPSSLGPLLVACSEKGICAIFLGAAVPGMVDDLKRRFPEARILEDGAGMAEPLCEVARWLETPGAPFSLALDARGTPFQKAVWAVLRGISAGETVSYTEVARRVGRPDAVRAVAGAIGANPLAVVVPCHRVIGRDGSLTGYHWGLELKRTLLAREARAE